MNPSTLAEHYLSSRMVSGEYAKGIMRTAGKIPSLDADAINAYLRARKDSVGSVTLANERRMLMTLMRFGYEERLIEEAPRGVMRVRQENPPVQAWSLESVKTLVNSSSQFSGQRFECGIDKGLFLETWCRLAYDTAARHGDIFSWTEANLHGDCVSWNMHKTGLPMTRRIGAVTQARVGELLALRRPLILGGICHRRHGFRLFRKLLKASGLAGSGKWLRRSSATHVELRKRGSATTLLGHKTPGLAYRSYVDMSQMQDDVMVPSID
jgi:hypothetical protein